MGSHESATVPAGAATADATTALDAIRRLVRFLRLADREAQAATGLSSAQLFVLHQLVQRPAESLAELAERTLTDPSSVSSVVDRLVRRGMVKRIRARDDGRRSELRITPIGARVIRTAPPAPQERIAAAMRELPAERRDEVLRALALLVASIGADQLPARMLFEDEPVRPRRSRGSARA